MRLWARESAILWKLQLFFFFFESSFSLVQAPWKTDQDVDRSSVFSNRKLWQTHFATKINVCGKHWWRRVLPLMLLIKPRDDRWGFLGGPAVSLLQTGTAMMVWLQFLLQYYHFECHWTRISLQLLRKVLDRINIIWGGKVDVLEYILKGSCRYSWRYFHAWLDVLLRYVKHTCILECTCMSSSTKAMVLDTTHTLWEYILICSTSYPPHSCSSSPTPGPFYSTLLYNMILLFYCLLIDWLISTDETLDQN